MRTHAEHAHISDVMLLYGFNNDTDCACDVKLQGVYVINTKASVDTSTHTHGSYKVIPACLAWGTGPTNYSMSPPPKQVSLYCHFLPF